MMSKAQLKGKWVEVYYNLHKNVLSVRRGGRVQLHTEALELDNVKFVVQPAGREKVLKEKRKNVHAFVRGNYKCSGKNARPSPWRSPSGSHLDFAYPKGHGWKRVRYNPYKFKTFMVVLTVTRSPSTLTKGSSTKSLLVPIHEAERVIIKDKEIWALL
jgi:hypothetical protein